MRPAAPDERNDVARHIDQFAPADASFIDVSDEADRHCNPTHVGDKCCYDDTHGEGC